MTVDKHLLARLAMAWLLALVGAHVALRVIRPDLGPEPGEALFVVFFGLNLPTMALGAFLPKDQKAWSGAFYAPVFLVGMAVIAANFMLTGAMMGGKATLAVMLAVLTAQALWLAWPICWAARHVASREEAPGGAVRRLD